MSLSPQFLDEVRTRTSLSTLVGRTVKLQRAGREWKACCPFHKEKTPSFYVNDEKGFWHCFGCGAHGDAIRWLTDARGLPFIDAVKELADAAGMEVPAADPRAQARAQRAAGLYDVTEAAARWFVEQLEGVEGTAAREYLQQRGISEETRKKFGFGFAPDARGRLRTALKAFGIDKLIEAGLLIQPEDADREPYDRFRGRLTFPIRDARGRCIAFSARILGAGEPKYLNSPETPLFDKGRTLFNLDNASPASRAADRVIVVEGQMDVIALDQAGFGEAVAPLGTALTEGQLERLWRLVPSPALCFDGDAAGQKAAMRAALRALPLLGPEKSLSFIVLPEGLDPDDLIRANGAKAFEKEIANKIPLDQFIWNFEYSSADFDTPEGRAAFGRRLREYARSIRDTDISTQYLAVYTQRLNDLFSPHKRRVTEAGRWLDKKSGPRPELVAILRYGTSKTLFAPAAIEGLRRYPAVISSHAEIVGHLSVLLLHRDLRLLCHEMLDAALGDPTLDPESLGDALKRAGLEPVLQRLAKRPRVPFSFLRNGVDPERARTDLAAVLEILAATPEIEASLERATQRLKSEGDDEAFAEQLRMRELRQRLDLDWADLLQRQSESDQADRVLT